jgi:hypothetical protein
MCGDVAEVTRRGVTLSITGGGEWQVASGERGKSRTRGALVRGRKLAINVMEESERGMEQRTRSAERHTQERRVGHPASLPV